VSAAPSAPAPQAPANGTAPLFTIWNAEADTWTTKAVDDYRGCIFTPIISMWDEAGQSHVLRLDGVSIAGDDLLVQAGTMSPGTHRLNLIASDVWGNASLLPLDVRVGSGVAKQSQPRRSARGAWLRDVVSADQDGRLYTLPTERPAGQVAVAVSPRERGLAAPARIVD